MVIILFSFQRDSLEELPAENHSKIALFLLPLHPKAIGVLFSGTVIYINYKALKSKIILLLK